MGRARSAAGGALLAGLYFSAVALRCGRKLKGPLQRKGCPTQRYSAAVPPTTWLPAAASLSGAFVLIAPVAQEVLYRLASLGIEAALGTMNASWEESDLEKKDAAGEGIQQARFEAARARIASIPQVGLTTGLLADVITLRWSKRETGERSRTLEQLTQHDTGPATALSPDDPQRVLSHWAETSSACFGTASAASVETRKKIVSSFRGRRDHRRCGERRSSWSSIGTGGDQRA